MILNFNCPREILLENLSIVSKAVATKSVNNLLECFYLNAENQTLTIVGNNNEISIKSKISVDIENEGKILVEAKIFSEMIRLMPEGLIEISATDDYLITIKNSKTKYELVGREYSSYPLVEEKNYYGSFNIKEIKLKEIIRKSIFAIGQDNSKPIYKGALFEIERDFLKVVTLDGFRLAVLKEEISSSETNNSFIIPGTSLNELLKILEDKDDIVTVKYNEKNSIIIINNLEFYSKLIEGEFFNYENIIPKESVINVRLNRSDFLRCIERCSLIISATAKEPVKFSICENRLDLLTISSLGKIEDSLEIQKVGEDLEIGFNHKYIGDILKSISEENIILNFTNSVSPCVVKDKNEKYLYLVLPVRLR